MCISARRLFLASCLATCLGMLPLAAAFGAYPDSALQALHWRLIGPYHGGRVDAVAGVASKPHSFYMGGADGGIWKSTDAGYSWHNVSDCCLAVGAIGALAVAPSNPDIIYAGTGEPFPRGDMNTGDGMWKSVDAGKTWTHIGLTQTGIIGNIIIDPHDPDHVYAAALGHVFGPNPQRGVYESTDGGTHWRRILYVNARTGANDLAMDPKNPNVLYASMWQVKRRPWTFSSGGPGSGIYKSTDGGRHWTNLTRNAGLPTGVLGKIGLAVAPTDPDRIYALVEAHQGGLYRSDDAGRTWHRLYHGANLTQRAFYFFRLYVDPKNADHIYSPQAGNVMISTDGGKQFHGHRIQGGDNHVLWINPEHPQDMIAGNDGGATVSLDGGQSWSRQDNQPLSQFYHVAVDQRFPFHLYGAQQDFATLEIASRNTHGYGIDRQSWQIIAQWESGYAVPAPGKPWISYTAGGLGGLIERNDARTHQHRFFGPWPENNSGVRAADLTHRFQWVMPLLVSQYDTNSLYAASQYVMESDDGGNSWRTISPDLTRNDKRKQLASGGPITKDITPVEYYDTVFALAQSPLKQGLLWAGTDDGKVWVTRDDGKHWNDITPHGLPKWTTVSSIDPSHFQPGTAYLAARRYRQNDYAPYLYVTTDYGTHWRKITRGLPDGESSFVVRQDTQDPDLLFAGTLRGVYVSFDNGSNWQPLQLDLPHTAVRDIAVQANQNTLAIATHGRGFWVLDNIQPLRELTRKALDTPAYLYTPQAAWLAGGHHDPNANQDNAGVNPPNGLAVFYNLKSAPNRPLTLTFTGPHGKTLAAFAGTGPSSALPIKPGLNRFVWDTRFAPPSAPAKSAVPGPRMVPGTYTVTLALGDTKQTRPFEIRKDPAIAASRDDLQARYDLLLELGNEINTIEFVVSRIEAEQKTLKTTLAKDPKDKKARQTLARLDAIKAKLVAPKAESYLSMLQHPTELEGKLGFLYFVVGGSFARPTRTDYEMWHRLEKQTDALIEKVGQ